MTNKSSSLWSKVEGHKHVYSTLFLRKTIYRRSFSGQRKRVSWIILDVTSVAVDAATAVSVGSEFMMNLRMWKNIGLRCTKSGSRTVRFIRTLHIVVMAYLNKIVNVLGTIGFQHICVTCFKNDKLQKKFVSLVSVIARSGLVKWNYTCICGIRSRSKTAFVAGYAKFIS